MSTGRPALGPGSGGGSTIPKLDRLRGRLADPHIAGELWSRAAKNLSLTWDL